MIPYLLKDVQLTVMGKQQEQDVHAGKEKTSKNGGQMGNSFVGQRSDK